MTYVLILLGWYLDLLLFLTVSAVSRGLILSDTRWEITADLGLFLVVRLLLMYFSKTPGQWLVAPAREERSYAPGQTRRQWANLFLGTAFFLEGTKRTVRWLEMDQPLPFMGFVPEGTLLQGAVGFGMGLLFLAVGCKLLRLDPAGKILGLGALAVAAVSTVLSWQLWDTAIERIVDVRRTTQGIRMRSDEVAFLQNLFPEGIVVVLIMCTGLLYLCRGRAS